MLRCFFNERFLAVSAWLRDGTDGGFPGAVLRFLDAWPIGVAASLRRRSG
jgi:hypothetical protein